MNKYIDEAKNILNELNNDKKTTPFDPMDMMEEALFTFITYRIQKLMKRMEFQENLINTLEARLPEADFNDIRSLLSQEEQHVQRVVSDLYSPFSTKVGESKNKKESQEEDIFNNSSKEDLQSVQELFQLINTLKESIKTKKESKKNESIKKILENSITEENTPTPNKN